MRVQRILGNAILSGQAANKTLHFWLFWLEDLTGRVSMIGQSLMTTSGVLILLAGLSRSQVQNCLLSWQST
jgi:hypothetical protein